VAVSFIAWIKMAGWYTDAKIQAPIGHVECFIPKRINITENEL